MRKLKKQFGKINQMVFGGATLLKGTDVLAHRNNPTALAGDIGGLASIGVAGGISEATLNMAMGGYKMRKRKRKKH